MDRKLKDILDRYFPYTDEESKLGVESALKRQAKFELRQKVEKVVIEYLEAKKENTELPSLKLDDIIKKLEREN